MRAVAVEVEQGVVLLDEVPAAGVVDLAVAVVVDPVRGVVDPDVRGEVGMRVETPLSITATMTLPLPVFRSQASGASMSWSRRPVSCRPQVAEARVVRERRGQVRDVVRLGELDGGIVLESLGGRGHRGALLRGREAPFWPRLSSIVAPRVRSALARAAVEAPARTGRSARRGRRPGRRGRRCCSGASDDGGLVGACTGRSQNQGGNHQHRRPKETRPHRARL